MTLSPAPAGSAIRRGAIGSFPMAIYQFFPHSTFPKMAAALPQIAAAGFDAVQMPPIHPPSTHEFNDVRGGGSKLGSAYAIKDQMRISPTMYAGVSSHDYLAGNFTIDDEQVGWDALSAFTAEAASLGLRVVGDIVFGHTAGDPGVLRVYEKSFGPDFYRRVGECFEVPGMTTEDGGRDEWYDIAPIHHMGPAKDKIAKYFDGVLRKLIDSGVSVFRADDAPRIATGFWQGLLAGAREYAATHGHTRPFFYAEALSSSLAQDIELAEVAKFDCLTNSLRWWSNLHDHWFVNRYEDLRRAGARSISFASSHDTTSFATMFPGTQNRVTRLAMTAFMSSALFIFEGTLSLQPDQPTVFLSKNGWGAGHVGQDMADEGAQMRSLVRQLLTLKRVYPIFRQPANTRIVSDHGSLVDIERSTADEEVRIVLNTGDSGRMYQVPDGFKAGNIFGTNTWPGGATWYGGPSGDEKLDHYNLSPGGMAVFHGLRTGGAFV